MSSGLAVLLQVVVIDITLAGDNAVVVALAVAGLPAAQRRWAIAAGLGAATVIRLGLSVVAISLLAVLGLTLAGGLLLLWVCYRMFRELRGPRGDAAAAAGGKSLGQAIRQIMIADLSMSLDNVLAVAGAARAHIWIMAGGLALSVIMMGVAAGVLARLLQRHRWIAWVGLAIVFYVAASMIVHGWDEVHGVVGTLWRRIRGGLLF
jgi:YjbE family integral membrane protein